jgi:hypothetical protein
MKVFTYVQVNDGGSAPNYDPPALTLAVCKPLIRRTAQRGDLVLAFAGRRLGLDPHGVRWAGVVAEKLTFAEYWADSRFAGKKPDESKNPDNFYRPTADGLEQVPNVTHGPNAKQTDTGGQYVLVFGICWRFGEAAPVIPQRFGLRMTTGRRGHRVADLQAQEWRALRDWLSNASAEAGLPMVPRVRPIRPTRRCS